MSSRELVLFGTDAPAPSFRLLQAGPLSVVLEDGQLRRICWEGREAIRGISFLLRNQNWGTYPAALSHMHVEESATTFKVSYSGLCEDDTQSALYHAVIVGNADGLLEFQARLLPKTDFHTCRAGFVVLHPLKGVAGMPLTVQHPDGRITQATFPKHIAPSQPLFDLRAMTHEVSPGVSVTCLMEGDAFEMEDQRNWSDASFKTYVRPLSKPFPYTLKAREEQLQSVSLTFTQTAGAPLVLSAQSPENVIDVGTATGTMPALALTVDSEHVDNGATIEAHLRALAPQWIVGRVSSETRMQELRHILQTQTQASAQLWLEVVVPCEGNYVTELSDLAQTIREAGLQPGAVTVTPQAFLKTLPAQYRVAALEAGGMTAFLHAARRAFPHAQIGGGALAYFTELNRNPPPASAIDFITHTTCPIIHAADDESVMETLESLPWIFESTRHLAGPAAYWLGATTLGMRHNPYGSAPAQNPHKQRLAMAKEDPRQHSLFGASFYLGYAAEAVRASLAVLAFCDTTGPLGVISCNPNHPGVFPAYHVLRWLAQAAHHPTLAIDQVGPPGVAVIAHSHNRQRVLLLANTTPKPQQVRVKHASHLNLLTLDETTVAPATQTGTWSDHPGVRSPPSFTLAPYAVARAILP